MFLPEDTAAVLALAAEEADTCQSCGYPKAWCRDVEGRGRFVADEDYCWATLAMAARREKVAKEKHGDSAAATQVYARFVKGYTPDVMAGLGLEAGTSTRGHGDDAEHDRQDDDH